MRKRVLVGTGLFMIAIGMFVWTSLKYSRDVALKSCVQSVNLELANTVRRNRASFSFGTEWRQLSVDEKEKLTNYLNGSANLDCDKLSRAEITARIVESTILIREVEGIVEIQGVQ